MPQDIEYVPAPDLYEKAVLWKAKCPETFRDVDIDRINFVRVLGSKQKTKYAVTIKHTDFMKYLNGNYDYSIQFFDHLVEQMGPANESVLVYHELRHVGGFDGNKHTLIKHDIEDHYEVLATWGLNWALDENLEDPLASDGPIEVKVKPHNHILESENPHFDGDEVH